MMETSIRKCWPVHFLMWFTVAISVTVHALIADVVLHVSAPLPVLDQLLHLDKIDGWSMSRTVGASQRQVLWSLIINTVGTVSLGIAQRW